MRKYIVVFTVFILFYATIFLVQKLLSAPSKQTIRSENIYQTYGLRAVMLDSDETISVACPADSGKDGKRIDALFVPISPEKIKGKMPQVWRGAQVAFIIEAKPRLLQQLSTHDTIVLPTKRGHRPYKIVRVHHTHRKSTVVEGSYRMNGTSYSAVISGRGTLLFASYSTPEGAYDIESVGHYGYVYFHKPHRKHSEDKEGVVHITRAP